MDDFFDVNFRMLKISGMWIPESNAKTYIRLSYLAYNVFWLTYCCLILAPSELAYLVNTYSNIADLIKNVSIGITHFLANVKVCLWFYYRKEIIGIIGTLGAYGRRYESYGDFDNVKIVQKAKKFKNTFARVFLIFGVFTSISGCTAGLVKVIREEIPEGGRVHLTLPYFSYIPFDYRTSKVAFSLAILYQFFPVFIYAYMIIGFDTLYTSMLTYVAAQFDIVQGAFETIRPRCLVRLRLHLPDEILHDPPFLMEAMRKEMNRVVSHLQVLLNICRRLEEMYTYIILSQVIISLIVLCTCIFLVSSLPPIGFNFAAELIYMIAVTFQLFNYCFFGNKVTISSSSVAISIYNGNWYSTSTSFKRSMIITMSRMQKPIYFTIGKFSPLTLTTFVTICRASYSFFAVLKNSDL